MLKKVQFKDVLIVALVCCAIFFGGREWLRGKLETLFTDAVIAFDTFGVKRDMFFFIHSRTNVTRTGWCITSDPAVFWQLQDVKGAAEEAMRLVRVYHELQTLFHRNDVHLVIESDMLSEYTRVTQRSLSRLMYIESYLRMEHASEYCVSKDISVPT